MNTNGVMGEIRGLLNQGTSSSEAITLGYKPSTVYKAQRQLRTALFDSEPPVTTQVVVANLAPEDWTKLRQVNNSLRGQVSSIEEVKAKRDSLRRELELESYSGRMKELATEASQAQMLQKRLVEVEPKAQAAAKLRREVEDLKSQLSHSAAVMAKKLQQWQAKLEKEQEARSENEDLVSRRSMEIERLRAENQHLAQRLDNLPNQIAPKLWGLIQPLQQEVGELRLLKVWGGHPCTVCGKPTSGVPTRELAVKLLRDGGYGHRECVKKRSWV